MPQLKSFSVGFPCADYIYLFVITSLDEQVGGSLSRKDLVRSNKYELLQESDGKHETRGIERSPKDT